MSWACPYLQTASCMHAHPQDLLSSLLPLASTPLSTCVSSIQE